MSSYVITFLSIFFFSFLIFSSHSQNVFMRDHSSLPFCLSPHRHRMSSNLLTLVGTVGSWLGSFVAHLLAILLAPILDSVPKHFFSPPPPPSSPAPPWAVSLEGAIQLLSDEIGHLRMVLVDRDEPTAPSRLRQSTWSIRYIHWAEKSSSYDSPLRIVKNRLSPSSSSSPAFDCQLGTSGTIAEPASQASSGVPCRSRRPPPPYPPSTVNLEHQVRADKSSSHDSPLRIATNQSYTSWRSKRFLVDVFITQNRFDPSWGRAT